MAKPIEETLKLALRALNLKPRFKVGDTDSYAIAAQIEEALTPGNPPASPPNTAVKVLKDIDLRLTQARLASSIGRPTLKQGDFLRSQCEQIAQLARDAASAEEAKTVAP